MTVRRHSRAVRAVAPARPARARRIRTPRSIHPFQARGRAGTVLQILVAMAVAASIFASSAQASFPAFTDPQKPRPAESRSPGGLPAIAHGGSHRPIDGGTSGAVAKTSASASASTTPGVTAFRLGRDAGIRLDGRLDDAAWATAEAGSGFQSWNPVRGGQAYGSTVFKVAYDDNAIYFGVACAEPNPAEMTKRLVRRDGSFESDNVAFYLDPYSDHTSGYYFAVNSLGVQGDGVLLEDGGEDNSWDGVWQAETFEDADGWYAEIRVPFSSIRYRPDAPDWGLDVFRETRARGQTDGWVVWDRDQAGFVSRFGHLDGIHGISAPRQLELLPYAVYSVTDPAMPNPEELGRYRNLGLDLEYGVTANLVANATVQPDFGQVEADPSSLNLTPYETVYAEKRPFFTEGTRYFSAPRFNVFYSRRIGTGQENARIRAAGKLTGKTKAGVSLGFLAATTDITAPGQAHNFAKTGQLPSNFFVARLGKEFADGRSYVNVMQTGVIRPGSRGQYGDAGSREAYSSEADFGIYLANRAYSVSGSFVGSAISSERAASMPAAPAVRYGSGGGLTIRKLAGKWLGTADGRWATDRLDLNDAGYLRSPDFVQASLNVMRDHRPTGERRIFNSLQANANLNLGWMHAGRSGSDVHTGERAWSYGPGHRTTPSLGVNYFAQFRNLWATWAGISRQFESTQRYDTRNSYVRADGSRASIPGGGVLLGEPATWTSWIGFESDQRRRVILHLETNYGIDWAHNIYSYTSSGVTWSQSSAVQHHLDVGYEFRTDDTQHLDNYENTTGGGIGGVSYVYGQLRQQTVDVTLRSSLLFDRNKSLELYAQPYISVGRMHGPREILHADTYLLVPYAAPGFNVEDRDFRYASVNVNAVYRWEYRPGSTLYLVWTHRRGAYDERWMSADPASYHPSLNTRMLFDSEPENTIMVKASWYLPV
jgi:hypothetical protein